MSGPLVQCRGVTVASGATTALAEADLEVRPRERVALVGRSGSGKTTLLHVLGGLVAPSSGSVEWKGQPLTALDTAARASIRRHGLAYVFQGANLLPYFSAVENVTFAAHLGGGDAMPVELLRLVGLADKADHLPAELISRAKLLHRLTSMSLCRYALGFFVAPCVPLHMKVR